MNNQQSDASRACEQHREPSIGLSDVYTSQVEFPTGFYDEFRDMGHGCKCVVVHNRSGENIATSFVTLRFGNIAPLKKDDVISKL